MKISITIDRGPNYGQDTEEGKKAKQTFKSLIATGFPVGIMYTKPTDAPQMLSYSGPITDFIKAMRIKKEFLAGSQTVEDKKAMNAKLMPIYQKSKDD